MNTQRLVVMAMATCAIVAANHSAAAPPTGAKPPAAPAPTAPRPAAAPISPATNPVARGPAQLPTGAMAPTGVTTPQGVAGGSPGRGPIVAAPTGAGGVMRPGATAPARGRPGEVVPAKPAAGAPGTAQPVAGATERPQNQAGGDPRYPSNRGFVRQTTQQVTLKPGQVIDRYGSNQGTFVAPVGTPVEQRSLPPGAATQKYSAYQVQKPIAATAGVAKPAYGQAGGGQQIELNKSVDQHKKSGDLKPWPPEPVPAKQPAAAATPAPAKKNEAAPAASPPPPPAKK